MEICSYINSRGTEKGQEEERKRKVTEERRNKIWRYAVAYTVEAR
jgi:hypothetical protein